MRKKYPLASTDEINNLLKNIDISEYEELLYEHGFDDKEIKEYLSEFKKYRKI